MLSIKKAIEQISPETYVQLYQNSYQYLLPDEELSKILAKADVVSDFLSASSNKIALLVGQVQAGKTAAYSAIIASLLDKGSSFIVVSPAIDNILLEQTFQRLDDTFGTKAKVLNVSDADIKEQVLSNISLKRKIILVSLKSKKRLQSVIEIIEEAKKYSGFTKPIFIDDEGDQASFDDKDKEEVNAVFNQIVKLSKLTYDISMLTVTATPMPQIFVGSEYEIKPDRVFYIKPGEQYFGIDKFMDENSNFITKISDSDSRKIIEDGPLPPSFRKAVVHFLVVCAIAHLRNEKIETQSMLLHIERLKTAHLIIDKKTKNLLNNFITKINSQHIELIKEVIKENSYEVSNFEDFVILFQKHAENVRISVINGENQKSVSDLHSPKKCNYIYIGSTMLQRGVTLKNLLITYFTYRSIGTLNADTVLQRARWFGYRKHLDLTKIYMSNEAFVDFKALSIMNPDLIEKLEYAEKHSLNFREFERTILLPDANIKATRDSVVKNRRMKLSRVIANNTLENHDLSMNLFEKIMTSHSLKLFKKLNFPALKFDNYENFKNWIGKEELDDLFNHIGLKGNDRKDLEDFISNTTPNFYIVDMINSDYEDLARRRDITSNTAKGTEFISIMQGENSSYPGDRYWFRSKEHNFENSIIVQLNKIKLTKEKIEFNEEFIYKPVIVSNERILGRYIHAEE